MEFIQCSGHEVFWVVSGNSVQRFVPSTTCCVFFICYCEFGLKVRLYAERTLCRSCSVLEVIHTHEHTHTLLLPRAVA